MDEAHNALTGTYMRLPSLLVLSCLVLSETLFAQLPSANQPCNVLFIVSDDLTSTALPCYGNEVCRTPNIDQLAARGTRFTRVYCQGTYCGPSRASFMSGYYPHATGVLGYKSPRPAIGQRATWAQHFKNAGYYTARVSKIYHMGVRGGIELFDMEKDPQQFHNRAGVAENQPLVIRFQRRLAEKLSEIRNNDLGG